MTRLAPEPLMEFYIAVSPEGEGRLSASKLDTYDPQQVAMIFAAALRGLVTWAERAGVQPAGVIGDGGPEVVRLRARLYDALGHPPVPPT